MPLRNQWLSRLGLKTGSVSTRISQLIKAVPPLALDTGERRNGQRVVAAVEEI